LGSAVAVRSVISRCSGGESEAATSRVGTIDGGKGGGVGDRLIDVVELRQ
jgi:hypothetical protein